MAADPDPSDGDRTTSGELVSRAQRGDRNAFDALIRRSEGALLRLVRSRLHGRLREELGEESRDLVQSALREAVRHLDDFDYRGEGSFVRWLLTIVEHKLRHGLRDAHRQKRDVRRVQPLDDSRASRGAPGPAAADPSPSMAASGREMEERYRSALGALEPVDQELLLLHLELGCTHEEIAAALSIASADAVRKRVARALAKLERAMLGGA